GSATAAANALKRWGVADIRLLSLIAAPEGIDNLARSHPDVRVFVAAIDQCLNAAGFIVPGLGDAGDRIFSTR
ncbi:MAG: uracil phosphoribosyltransferase, partial [Phycisphaerae bacterium]|nr:uracil phosphoribosyltransferase [Phycisphaerae bacterium]